MTAKKWCTEFLIASLIFYLFLYIVMSSIDIAAVVERKDMTSKLSLEVLMLIIKTLLVVFIIVSAINERKDHLVILNSIMCATLVMSLCNKKYYDVVVILPMMSIIFLVMLLVRQRTNVEMSVMYHTTNIDGISFDDDD